MELLILEIVAGVVAAIFLVKFIRGRRLIVDRSGELFPLKTSKGVVQIPEELRENVAGAIERALSSEGKVIESVIRDEGNRIRAICKRRRIGEEEKLTAAITELLRSQRDMRLALEELEAVPDEKKKRKREREVKMEELEDRSDEIRRRKRKRDWEEEMRELDLEERRKKLEERSRKYRFDDFGAEEEE